MNRPLAHILVLIVVGGVVYASIEPTSGQVTIDQARPGPGALTVTVNSQVPNSIPDASVTTVGTGCGLILVESGRPVLGTTIDLATAAIPPRRRVHYGSLPSRSSKR